MPAALQNTEDTARPYVYLHDSDQMKTHEPQIYEALQLMKRYSALGERFVTAATENRLGFRKSHPGARGHYINQTIETDPDNSLDVDAGGILPHEMMHWLQTPVARNTKWDFRTRLLATLASEAAAETCAIRVSYEMKLGGYARAFNLLAAPYAADPYVKSYSDLYQLFDRTYKATRAQEQEPDECLLDAGDAVFGAYMKDPRMVITYGLDVLKDYMEEVGQGKSTGPPVPAFSIEEIRNQAHIAGDEFLIREADIPLSDDVLFRDNRPLRQAFAYIEALHIQLCSENTSLDLHRKIAALQADDNPFLETDLGEVLNKFETASRTDPAANLLLVMMDVAGIKKAPAQMSLKFPEQSI